MSDTTANLGLPYIQDAQAQKHVTHNEALRQLDGLVQLSVKDRDLTAPPGSPSEGDRYLVAAGATGEWSGWDGDVAMFADGSWWRLPARAGWLCFVEDEAALLVRVGASWQTAGGGVTGEDLSDGTITLLGVNTGAEANNRLAVKSDAVLLSHDDVTPGSGDMRVSLNKAATERDAGFVFQDDWSTRALFGLLASNDFIIKVSADGSTFHDGVVIDKDSGAVSLPGSAKFSSYMLWSGPNFDVAADAWTKVPFNNATHNDHNAFDAVDSAFVAPADGYYQFGAYFACESDTVTTSEIIMGLSVDFDVPAANRRVLAVAEAGKTCAVQVTALLKLTAGQKVYVLTQFNGADGTILDDENYFWGHRVP